MNGRDARLERGISLQEETVNNELIDYFNKEEGMTHDYLEST